jgi:tetratricopeptide (TPR) repeat protein
VKKISYSFIIILIILLNFSFSQAKVPKIVMKQERAVVTIYVKDKDGKQTVSGNGFIIDSKGIIATNYHVVSKCLENGCTLLVKMENGGFSPLIEIINYDEENDVAIFKIDGKELPTVKLAKNYKPKQGEDIIIVGSPTGPETESSDNVISSINGKDEIFQITAPISPGSSGSPVFNSKGEVIGIATFLIKSGENLYFAIPVRHVENLLKGNKKPKKDEIITSKQLTIPAPLSTPGDGHRLELKGGDLFYTSSITLYEANKLGTYLVEKKFFEGIPLSIQLNKNCSTYEFRLALNKEVEVSEEDMKIFKSFSKELSNNVFGGSPVEIHLCDENFQTKIKFKFETPAMTIASATHQELTSDGWYDKASSSLLCDGKCADSKKAIEYLNEAIKLQPDSAEAYTSRGIAYDNLGQHERAIEDFNAAIRLPSDNADAYYNRGNAYSSLKQYQRAIEDYNEVIRLKPDYANVYNNRGDAYSSLKQYQRAIDDFGTAIRLKPDHADAYYNRGCSYDSLNQQQLAIEDYSQAIRLKPDHADAYYNMGNDYSYLKQYQRAIDGLNDAIRLKPDYANAYNNRGLAYFMLDNIELGCHDAQKACSLGVCKTLELVKGKGYCR